MTDSIDMIKTMRRTLILFLAALICLCSCEKQGHSSWLCNAWRGTYDVILTDNETGEIGARVATISLHFSDDRSECIVEEMIQGSSVITRKIFRAYLNEEERIFILNEGVYDSRILYRGDVASDGKLTLIWWTERDVVSAELAAH